jgi:uncharacterized membrane protein YadS
LLTPEADDDDLLKSQLTILDIANVLTLGRQAGDSAQRRALFKFKLIAVEILVPVTVICAKSCGSLASAKNAVDYLGPAICRV